MEELMAHASQSSEDGSQPPPIDIDTLYLEAAGGEKKRRVYGFGSQAASFYSNSFQSTGNSYASHVAESTARMRELSEKQAELDRKQAEMQAELERKQAEMQAELDRKQAEMQAQFNIKFAELDAKTERLNQMEEQMSRLMEQMQSGHRFHRPR